MMIGYGGGVALVQHRALEAAKEEERKNPHRVDQYSVLKGVKYVVKGPGKWRKRLLFCISLIFTSARRNAWWTEVARKGEAKLYLSAIPLKGNARRLRELGVCRILTLLEQHERVHSIVEPIFVAMPEGVGQKIIEAKDFLPLSAGQISEGVRFVQDELDAGRSVLVHCKAGVGRSASVVLAYLMLEALENGSAYPDAKEAYKALKRLRPQVNLNKRQLQAVQDWYAAQVEMKELKGTKLQTSEGVRAQLGWDLGRQLFKIGSGEESHYAGERKVGDFERALEEYHGEAISKELFDHIALFSQQGALDAPLRAAIEAYVDKGAVVQRVQEGSVPKNVLVHVEKNRDGTWTVTHTKKMDLRGKTVLGEVILEAKMHLSADGAPLGFESSHKLVELPV